MASQDSFDPYTFLAYIDAGGTLAAYRQHSPIFAQGEAADAVFYTQDGHGPHSLRADADCEARVLHAEPTFSALFVR
jgi:hypothetical protein